MGQQAVVSDDKQNTAAAIQARQERVRSHTFVELRRFKHLPIFCHSAVLLDVSLGGFKIEFTGEVKIQPGQKYWMMIPLGPIGIPSPSRIYCLGECRWFDDTRFRMGGIFLNLGREEITAIEKIVTALKKRSQI